MDTSESVFYTAGLPALISTGITFLYFLLKACRYVYAVSHKTQERLAEATPGCGPQEHSPNTRKEGHTEVYEQISGDNTEQYGTRTQRSPGSLFVPRRWQDVCFPSCQDAAEYSTESPVPQNAKRLQGGRHRNTTDYYGKGPMAHMITPQEYLQKVAAGLMPQMDNHQMMKELVEKNEQTKILMMEFRDIEHPLPPTMPQPPKHK